MRINKNHVIPLITWSIQNGSLPQRDSPSSTSKLIPTCITKALQPHWLYQDIELVIDIVRYVILFLQGEFQQFASHQDYDRWKIQTLGFVSQNVSPDGFYDWNNSHLLIILKGEIYWYIYFLCSELGFSPKLRICCPCVTPSALNWEYLKCVWHLFVLHRYLKTS